MIKKIAVGLLMVFYVHLFIHFSLWDFSGADSVAEKLLRVLGVATLATLIVGMVGVILGQSWARQHICEARYTTGGLIRYNRNLWKPSESY